MAGTDDRLEELLGAWGDRHRLGPHEAEEIRRAIVEPAPGPASQPLPATWWTELSAHVTAAVVRANAPWAASAEVGTVVTRAA